MASRAFALSLIAAAMLAAQPSRAAMPVATAAHPLVYLIDSDYPNVVDVFQAGQTSPNPMATISAGVNQPQSLGVDARGNLYVNNWGGKNAAVTVYAPGATNPSSRRHPGGSNSYVGPDGALYVELGGRSIGEYVAGKRKPVRTMTVNDGYLVPEFADDEGNFYALHEQSFTYPRPWDVLLFPKGSSLGAPIYHSVDRPSYGFTFDSARELVVINDLSFSVYRFGQQQGLPIRLLTDPFLFRYQIQYAATCANGDIFVAGSQGAPNGGVEIAELDGQTGAVRWRIGAPGNLFALAVSPVARF